MLSDSEPDPLDKLETIIKKVDRNIIEKKEKKRKAKLIGKVCSSANFKCTTTSVLQEDFEEFNDSVQKYVSDVRSCTGLDIKDNDNCPSSPNLTNRQVTDDCSSKSEDALIADRKALRKLRKKEHSKKKIAEISESNNVASELFADGTDSHQTLNSSSDNEPLESKSNGTIFFEENEHSEDSEIDLVELARLEKEKQAKREAREAAHRAWSARKTEEQRKKIEKERKFKEMAEQKKESVSIHKQMQEDNFNSWVTRKREEKKVTELIEEMRRKEAAQEFEKERRYLKDKTEASRLWRLRKLAEAKQKKEAEQEALERKAKIKAEKAQVANETFNNWLKTAHLKPKPTPSGQGEESYIVRNIGWINPVPWRTATNDTSSDDDTF